LTRHSSRVAIATSATFSGSGASIVIVRHHLAACDQCGELLRIRGNHAGNGDDAQPVLREAPRERRAEAAGADEASAQCNRVLFEGIHDRTRSIMGQCHGGQVR